MAELTQLPTFTPHQIEAIKWLGIPAKVSRSLYWAGSVRSAKTYGGSILSFVAGTRQPGLRLLHCASSEDSYDRNILPYLLELGKRYDVHVARRSRPPRVEIGESVAYIYGGGAEGAHKTLQGFSSEGTFLDEVTLMPQSFVTEAIARTTAEDAKIVMTMNPEGPAHWFKREYWDNAESAGAKRITSRLTDNPYVPQSVRDFLSSTLTGHYYERKILGRWAGAEGLVFPIWQDNPLYQTTEFQAGCDIAVDFGQAAPTAALAIRRLASGEYIVDGEYYSNLADQDITVKEHADRIQALAQRHQPCQAVIIDPAAAPLRVEIQRRRLPVRRGNNDRDTGIQNLRQRLESGELQITSANCPNLTLEIQSLEWDSRATDRGEDRTNPNQADHALDALRYWAMHRLPPMSQSAPVAKPSGL